jgi:hypothetical protein
MSKVYKYQKLRRNNSNIYGGFAVDQQGNAYVAINPISAGSPSAGIFSRVIKYLRDGSIDWGQVYDNNGFYNYYINYADVNVVNDHLVVFGSGTNSDSSQSRFSFIQAINSVNGSVIWRTDLPGFFFNENLKVLDSLIQIFTLRFNDQASYIVNAQLDFSGNLIHYYEKTYQSQYTLDFNYICRNGDVLIGKRGFGYEVARINMMVDTLWAYELPNPNNSSRSKVLSLIEDENRNSYFTGTVDDGNNVSTVTTKLDATGQLVWQDVFRANPDDQHNGGEAVALIEKYVVYAGFSQKFNNEVFSYINVLDKETGEHVYQINLTDSIYYVIHDLSVDRDKIYYVGTYDYRAYPLETTHLSTGCIQLPMISADNEPTPDPSVLIAPNPTTRYLHLSSIDTRRFATIGLYNTNGVCVARWPVTDADMDISLAQIPAGIYSLSLEGKGIRLSKKVVKVK